MEKHAIPQNIMDVEFKLFGSLTIRQFFSLAGSILIAVVIYFIGLPVIVGWPLIIVSLAIGFAMTFMTVNGQPFTKWFTNFIAAMFSSQRYVWRKNPETPKALKYTTGKKLETEKSEAKVNKQFGALPIMEIANQARNQIDDYEESELSRLDKYFNAEFGKTFGKRSQSQQIKRPPIQRVDSSRQNIAGTVNPTAQNQKQVSVGENSRVLYSQYNNQNPRPLGGGESVEEDEIEKRVQAILSKQQELDPYAKTKQVEKREAELREEMRKLYNEIQSIKKNN